LLSSTRPPAGKKVTCPACGHAFVPDLPEETAVLAGPVKANPTDADDAPRRKRSSDPDDPDDRPRSKSKSRVEEDEDDDRGPPRKRRRYEDDDDDLPIKKKKKKKQANSMMLIGLLLAGGGVLLVFMIMCGIGAFVWPGFLVQQQRPAVAQNKGEPPRDMILKPGNVQTFTVLNLGEDLWEDRSFTFQQGNRVSISMVSTTTDRDCDVDLLVLRGPVGEDVIDEDVTIGPNGRVSFVVPNTGIYRIRVDNLGPGVVRNSTVTITVQ
jgi:hypothetical protein